MVAPGFAAPAAIFPLRDVRPGQHGVGRTVFAGNRIEEFEVEVLGVLENIGPKQSVILARLSGGPIEKAGVMQGMSGSPVYIDGRLAGAVALAFPYAKEPIAGIRPIEEMYAINPPVNGPRETSDNGGGSGSKLVQIATPLAFAGFSGATLTHFSPELRKLGLEPVQGLSGAGHLPPHLGDPSLLHPGDMISVELLSGDMSIGAEGTVTSIDGPKVYAFGHQFMAVGNTDLPFARAEVLTVLPSLSSSFKISNAREWMGAITQDRSTSVYGELGRRASTVPLVISVRGSRHVPQSYSMDMVNDRVLSPLILQMAVFSAIDATERNAGISSYAIHGSIRFRNGIPPISLDNTWAGDTNVPALAAFGTAAPLAYAMAAGFDQLKIEDIKLSIEAEESKRVLQVDQVTARRDIHPGETIDLTATLAGENGVELLKRVSWHVPPGIPAGPLLFTVSDGYTANVAEYPRLLATPKSPGQVVSTVNSMRPNTGAYLRVWRNETSYQAQGADLPHPPASVALVFAKAQTGGQTMNFYAQGSTVAEIPIDTGDAIVTGSKTIQVEVKE